MTAKRQRKTPAAPGASQGQKRGRAKAAEYGEPVMVRLPERQVEALDDLLAKMRKAARARGVSRSMFVRALLDAFAAAGPERATLDALAAVRAANPKARLDDLEAEIRRVVEAALAGGSR